jgi:hypothetical protein
MILDANNLAMALGQGPHDAHTFREATYQDADGNLYAVASTLARPNFPTAAASPLSRPEWDTEPYTINMAGAERAQGALVVYNPDAPATASPDTILAVIHTDAKMAIELMGLTQVEEDDIE